MKRIIIFDFNRTLYDPDSKALIPNAHKILKYSRVKGFELYLITRAEGFRKELLDNLGIKHYFREVIFTNDKKKKDFQKILQKKDVEVRSSFVVGDRAWKEIAIGNSLGFKTIWVKRGKFQNELPRKAQEYPTHMVEELREIISLI